MDISYTTFRFYLSSIIIKVILICLPLFSTQIFSQLAQGHSKFLGNVYGNITIHSTYLTYWNQITPENRGKWIYNEPGHDIYDWGGFDTAYNYAIQNYMPFKEHTLIWGDPQGQPHWLPALDSLQQAQEVEEWIQLVAQRYPYTDMVDVVNEAIHKYPNFADALGGSGTTGWDWVIWCFQKARQYFSANTKLLINEFNIINDIGNTNQYIDIINLLKAQNLIDGIGVQSHYFSLEFTNISVITSNLDALAATGLPIYISESESDVADDSLQLAEYQRVFPVIWEHPGVAGVTLWGYTEGTCWKPNGYLLCSNGNERPALQWLRSYLSNLLEIEKSKKNVPAKYILYQNYPNPFNPTTTIEYSIQKSNNVKLNIYDINGKLIRTLVDSFKSAGIYSLVWDAKDNQMNKVASGIYFYQLKTDNYSIQKKMILLQ